MARFRTIITTAVALALTASLATTVAGPAGAETAPADTSIGIPTTLPTATPVTWVDEEGRQYLVGNAARCCPGTDRLVVARSDADGDPDPTWGSLFDQDGLRELVLEPPAEGVEVSGIIALDGDGILSTSWAAAGCDAGTSCTRWFQRYELTGTPVGGAASIVTDLAPIRGLPDGSFTATNLDDWTWWSPLGADLGLPAGASAYATTIDAAGNLLTAGPSGTFWRWPAGGPAAQTVDHVCTTGQPTAVAAAADGGFAVVCTTVANEVGPPHVTVTVHRFTSGGIESWHRSGTDPHYLLEWPRAAVVDEHDRVWVGGLGEYEESPDFDRAYAVVLQSYTEGGTFLEHERWRMRSRGNGGVVDVRLAPDGRVAFADLLDCCDSSGGPDFLASATAGRLPHALTAPTCQAGRPTVTAADEDSVTVRVEPCASWTSDERPTSYLLQDESSSKTVPGEGPYEVELPAYGGHQSQILSFARNEAGFGPASPRTFTVAPFTTVEGFVAAQYHSFFGRPPTAQEMELGVGSINGTGYTGGFILDLTDRGLGPRRAEPVARLYRSYFQRSPDLGGYRYWVRRRSTSKLALISSTFAASSEFERRYGSLADRAFVRQVYLNVLGREPDAGGWTFWTNRLATRRNSRGEVMLQFSESTENIRTSKDVIWPLATAFLLLDRLPTSAERTAWAAFGSPRLETAYAVYGTAEYAAHH